MALVEVDELQLGNLKQVATIADALLKNPKTRKAYLSSVKEAFPTIAIPEIDAAAPVVAEIDGLKAQMSEFLSAVKTERDAEKTERARRSVDRRIEEGRALMRKRGYTDEAIPKIEAMMTEEGIHDYNNALKVWEYDNPPATPGRPSRGNMFDFIDESQKPDSNEYIKALFSTKGEDDTVLNKQVGSVLSDMRVR